jgi:hypothetical protein
MGRAKRNNSNGKQEPIEVLLWKAADRNMKGSEE